MSVGSCSEEGYFSSPFFEKLYRNTLTESEQRFMSPKDFELVMKGWEKVEKSVEETDSLWEIKPLYNFVFSNLMNYSEEMTGGVMRKCFPDNYRRMRLEK